MALAQTQATQRSHQHHCRRQDPHHQQATASLMRTRAADLDAAARDDARVPPGIVRVDVLSALRPGVPGGSEPALAAPVPAFGDHAGSFLLLYLLSSCPSGQAAGYQAVPSPPSEASVWLMMPPGWG